MKILDIEQRTDEWFQARIGLFTASDFDKIITPLGKKSTSIDLLTNIMCMEIIENEKRQNLMTAAIERGLFLEQEAITYYEMFKNVTVDKVGFCLAEEGYYGCSPDGLVGNDGLIEAKCAKGEKQIRYILSGEELVDYKPQIQGGLLVTGREWNDLVAYHPAAPVIIRFYRDEAYIKNLKEYLAEGKEILDSKLEKLKQKGYL